MTPLGTILCAGYTLTASRLLRCRNTALARALSTSQRWTLDTPFISDTIPLAEGVLGTVEELIAQVGQPVEHNEVIAVIETDKVVLDVKASRSGVIEAVLVKVGEEVKEKQPIYRLRVESE